MHQCTVRNCRIESETADQLAKHLRLDHKLCPIRGCKYVKPFGKQSDLNRHLRTVHESYRVHLCPYEDCPAHATGYKRKDKLKKHLKDKHRLVRCQQAHCAAVIYDVEQQAHIEQKHGPLECGLGSCRSAGPSHFNEETLGLHLSADHGVFYDDYSSIVSRACRSDTKTVQLRHLTEFQELGLLNCSLCQTQQGINTVLDQYSP